MKIILIIVSVWNLVTFLMMGVDKWKAKHGAWRIPERVLLICAFLLGSVGAAAGMYCFRHKTRHWRFAVGLPAMLVLHIAVAVYLISQGVLD